MGLRLNFFETFLTRALSVIALEFSNINYRLINNNFIIMLLSAFRLLIFFLA